MATVHAVVFPYPSQGHINPMFQLVSRLLERGFYITFINTEHNHERILKNGASEGLLSSPNLRFVLTPDGLPPEHGRLNENVAEFMEMIDKLQPLLLEKLVEIVSTSAPIRPVTCIISDSVCSWMQDVADAVNLPRVVLWTTPVHASLAYCSYSLLKSKGFVPFKGDEDRSRLLTCIPGLPPLLACDMISFFQTEDFFFHWIARHFVEMPSTAQWNLGNNIYELEKDAADEFSKQHVRSFLPIGPLLPASYFDGEMTAAAATSLWAADASCKDWLDKQEARSVLYISFGSIVRMWAKQVEEVALGLEASGHAFLWVLRSDVDVGTRSKIQAFQERTQGRGLVVSWAPQLSVLSHPSVGAFLTHCGWNSLIECMSAGLPILAWPGGFGEQPMNARYVVDTWKIGTEFKCEESHDDGQMKLVSKMEVERVIKAVMASAEGEQLRRRALEVKQVAKAAVAQGGSSHQNLDHFVKAMTLLARQDRS